MRNFSLSSVIFGFVLALNIFPVWASNWSDTSHEIYFIDYRGDGAADDILVEGKKRIVGIPYDIDVELASDEVSYVLERNDDGIFDLKEFQPGYEFDGEKISADSDFEILSEDLNNDGLADHRIQSKDSGGTNFVVTASENEGNVELEYVKAQGNGTPQRASYPVQSYPEAATIVGTTEGSFNVNGQGSATYRLDIEVPEGLNGHSPSLAVNYNDKYGNSILGQGWNLSGIPTINRCSKTPAHGEEVFGGVTLTENDRLCVGGQRLILDEGGEYWDANATYRPEVDNLTRYKRSGEDIVATQNDGTEIVYKPLKQELWAISQETDPFDHQIKYEYHAESANSQATYPSLIKYGESEIHFTYQNGRNDKLVRYLAGNFRDSNKFLKRIHVSLSGKPIRDYNFHYKSSDLAEVLTLKNIQTCSADLQSGKNECSLPLELDQQPELPTAKWKSFPLKDSFDPDETVSLRTMDWNRDGFDDLVRSGRGGAVEIRYGGPAGASPKYETLETGSDDRYMVTPFITNDGSQGIIYLTGELIQEEYNKTTKEGYYERIDDGGWKNLGVQCDVNTSNGNYSVVYHGLPDNTPDQYGRTWLDVKCKETDWNLYDSTATGYAIAYYAPYDKYHPPEYDVLPYDFMSFKYSWKRQNYNPETRSLGSASQLGHNEVRLCLTQEDAASFNPQTDLYKPIVGDFDADGETDIFVASPSCDSPDFKDMDWSRVTGQYTFNSDFDLKMLNYQSFNYDSEPGSEILEQKNGTFRIHDDSSVFELETENGGVITSRNSIPIDVNGDGLTDIVSFGDYVDDRIQGLDTLSIFINEGGTFLEARELRFSGLPEFSGESLSRILHLPVTESNPLESRVRVLDHDKNGIADILILNGPDPEVSAHGNELILLRGFADSSGQPVYEIESLGITQPSTEDLVNKVLVFDADGDGGSDILVADGGSYKLYGRETSYENKVTDFITSYPNGDEHRVALEYGRLNNDDVHEFSYVSENEKRTFASSMSVVRSVSLPTPSGEPGNVQYKYKNAQRDLNGRGFLGFESLTKTSSYENIEEQVYFWGAELPGVSPYSYNRQIPEFPYIGRVLAKTVKNLSNDQIIRKTLNLWSARETGIDGVVQPYLHKSFSRISDPEGNSVIGERVTHTLDGYGNRRSKLTEKGVSDTDPFKCIEGIDDCGLGVIDYSESVVTLYRAAHPTFLNERQITYKSPTLSLEGREVGGEKQQSSITKYSPADSWPYVVGDKTTSSGSQTADGLKETFSYEPTANGAARLARLSVESPAFVPAESRIEARTDQISQYSYGVFPEVIVNPEGHTTTLKIDYRHGKPTETIDSNSLRVRQQYDPLGRSTRVDNPDGSGWVRKYEFCDGQNCQNYSALAAYFVREHSHDGSYSEAYYDQFGNQVVAVETGFDGQPIIQKTVFDQRGRKERESYPHVAGQEALFKQYTYRDDKDLQTLAFPDGATETRYRQGTGSGVLIDVTKTLTKDENGTKVPGRTIRRAETRDSRGQTVEISEYKNASEALVTQLSYDAKGRLIRTKNISADSSETSIVDVTYDDAGNRKILDDPDTGRTITTFNSAGEVVEETQLGLITDNGNSKTFAYEHDRLGRKVARIHSESEAVDTWHYDTDQEGRNCGFGRLCSVQGGEFYEEYAYEPTSGKLKTIRTIIDSDPSSEPKQFEFSYRYDQFGRERQVEYPSGFTILRLYRNGFLSEIQDVTNGSENSTLWSARAYNVYGELKEASLGNGLTTRREFDERGRVRSIQSGTGTASAELIQASEYGYDSDGNLISRENKLEGIYEAFTYDGLNRLRTEEVGSDTWQYSYDDFGNLKQKREVDDYHYGGYGQSGACASDDAIDAPGPHAVTMAGGRTYCYDEFGNQVSSDDRVVEYNRINKPVSLTKGSLSVTYKYGPDGARFYQSRSGLTEDLVTYYVRSGLFEEEALGNKVIQKSYVDGILIDEKDVGTEKHSQYYTLKDHLGSVVSIVDSDVSDGLKSSEVQRLTYAPFGSNEINSSQAVITEASVDDHGFTGHEHIVGLDLVHMNGRVYDPVLGRFLSADPLIQAPKRSQSYNRYSYVWNNPLSATDPSGYISELTNGQLSEINVSGTIHPALIDPISNHRTEIGNFSILEFYGVGYGNRKMDGHVNDVPSKPVGPEVGDVAHASPDLANAAGGFDVQNGGCPAPMACAVGDGLQGTEFGVGTALGGASATASAIRYSHTVDDLARGIQAATRVVDDVHPAYYQQLNATQNAVSRLNSLSKGLGIAGGIPSAAMYTVNMAEGNYNAAALNASDILMTAVGFIPPYGTAASVAYFTGRFAIDYNTKH